MRTSPSFSGAKRTAPDRTAAPRALAGANLPSPCVDAILE